MHNQSQAVTTSVCSEAEPYITTSPTDRLTNICLPQPSDHQGDGLSPEHLSLSEHIVNIKKNLYYTVIIIIDTVH